MKLWGDFWTTQQLKVIRLNKNQRKLHQTRKLPKGTWTITHIYHLYMIYRWYRSDQILWIPIKVKTMTVFTCISISISPLMILRCTLYKMSRNSIMLCSIKWGCTAVWCPLVILACTSQDRKLWLISAQWQKKKKKWYELLPTRHRGGCVLLSRGCRVHPYDRKPFHFVHLVYLPCREDASLMHHR